MKKKETQRATTHDCLFLSPPALPSLLSALNPGVTMPGGGSSTPAIDPAPTAGGPAPDLPDAVASAAGATADAAADASAPATTTLDEPEEECGFCVFMKGGGCKDEFEVRGPAVAAWVMGEGRGRGGSQSDTGRARPCPHALALLDRGRPSLSLSLSILDTHTHTHTHTRAHSPHATTRRHHHHTTHSHMQAWSKCVDDHRTAGDDFAAACHPATAALQACMAAHAGYYREFLADADALAADAALAAGQEEGAGAAPADAAAPPSEEAGAEAAAPAPAAREAVAAPATAAAAAAAAAGLAAADTIEPPTPAGAAGAAADALTDAAVATAASPAAGAPALSTPPADPRFPGTNQARHCYTAYNMFWKCVREAEGAGGGGGGADAEAACADYAKTYRSLCPSDWVERWNEQRADGRWPGKY
jgi:cytochrome c oxidase subunit 6b